MSLSQGFSFFFAFLKRATFYPRARTGNCTLDQYGDSTQQYGVYRCEMVEDEYLWSLIDEYQMDFGKVYNREGVH